ncbi:MAG: hypothetical protein Q4D61_04140 [Cardiobacteriaceae bacterium]|nr:hypothetical protein [Cardiobacteriaceae bacterium]
MATIPKTTILFMARILSKKPLDIRHVIPEFRTASLRGKARRTGMPAARQGRTPLSQKQSGRSITASLGRLQKISVLLFRFAAQALRFAARAVPAICYTAPPHHIVIKETPR